MKMIFAAALLALPMSVHAQSVATEATPATAAPVQMVQPLPAPPPATPGRVLPASTMVVVTPMTSLTSKRMRKGDKVQFAIVNDVMEGGVVAIPRGTPVNAEITWKTGRAIGGKSGKFEVTFKTLTLNSRDYAMRGTYRQEGRGNTVGALLGSIVISGRSATMEPGQTVNAFTAEPISF